MITKFMTEITAKFNPFSACAKPARLFLTFLPPNARANGTSITTTLLPRNSNEPSSLRVKFKDGKELKFDCAKINIKGVVEEVNRHSRQLQKAADLTD
ncbi:ribosomal protein L44 [Metarhizium album ARSEF 1941]|uniref:Large ribosomal subunit protein mL53 n=1 Tax=Metarhizium album (strain ARSEF 1941) TaxID=1081103 RepID=A0A0B2WVA3_METAS|nr:ribosomal protein L44 [Metarhizium album ARSEF 1941]KHO00042.1 ribosomal protein L44 [Metarhizium album ARSEF 1941]